MTPRLIVDASRCQGCLACVSFCSMAKEGMVSPSRARLRVNIDPFGGETRIATCRQCKGALCADVCPVEAIRMDPEGDYWMVDYEVCTGCQVCIEACRFDAMLYDPAADRVIKCDTCDGNPTCADICPTGALRWVGTEEERR